MKLFFSCDWGTSTFRLRLIDAGNLKVLSATTTGDGIAAVFERWKQENGPPEKRMSFYKNYLLQHIKTITGSFDGGLFDAPVIISGMVSSNIGMMELPYKDLPVQCTGADFIVHWVEPAAEDDYRLMIISGVRSQVDVMRGEETMLAGCNILHTHQDQLLIFPGTHSKHVTVKYGLVTNIATYLTGEIFELLGTKSILAAAVKKRNPAQNTLSRFFAEGVEEGCKLNLLNSLFHVRVNQLFKMATAEENYDYLSGLLIGHELKGITESKPGSITLVCGDGLKTAYMQALTILLVNCNLQYKNADEALIKGQRGIMWLSSPKGG